MDEETLDLDVPKSIPIATSKTKKFFVKTFPIIVLSAIVVVFSIISFIIFITFIVAVSTISLPGSNPDPSSQTFTFPQISITSNPDIVLATNPGRGLSSTSTSTTTYEFGIIYRRFYWNAFEPTRGNYDWTDIDDILQYCKDNNKLFATRLSTHGGPHNQWPTPVPTWLYDLMGDSSGVWDNGYWFPDFNNPTLLSEIYRLIDELARKLNGNPLVIYMDIGHIGFWGEWHLWGLPEPYKTNYMPTFDNAKAIIDYYLDTFTDTNVVMLVGPDEEMEYASSKGAGLRADCLGDWGSGWNHMTDKYPESLEDFGDLWKTSIVAFETCSNFNTQYGQGYDLPKTFNMTLDWHGSTVNNKNAAVDSDYEDSLYNDLVKHLGYRFIIKNVEWSVEVRSNNDHLLNVQSIWENVGVAPIYFNATMEWKLTINNTIHILQSNEHLRTWLPNEEKIINENLSFNENIINFNEDEVFLDVCISHYLNDEMTEKMAIALAIMNVQTSDGCYSLK